MLITLVQFNTVEQIANIFFWEIKGNCSNVTSAYDNSPAKKRQFLPFDLNICPDSGSSLNGKTHIYNFTFKSIYIY